MASEGIISLPVVEDVLKNQATRTRNIDLAPRKEEESALLRYEAAAWLRRVVGVVVAKDLPEEPTEEEFRLGLRNGIVLCNALNKIQPDAVPKVVEAPADTLPDGAALSALRYFENVRNFLGAMEQLGLSTFEASDVERGGKSSRVVSSVLALKSYGDKQGFPKYGGNIKSSSSGKCFVRRNSELFTHFFSRSRSFQDGASAEQYFTIDFLLECIEMKSSPSISMLVRSILSDKKPEQIPSVVESILSKLMQEFEHRIASQKEKVKAAPKNPTVETRSFCEASNSKEVQSIQSNCCENKVKASSEDVVEKTRSFCEASNSTVVQSAQSTFCDNKAKETSKDQMEKTRSICEASNSAVVESNRNENIMVESKNSISCSRDKDFSMTLKYEELAKQKLLKQSLLVEKQRRQIQDLKDALVTTRASVQLIRTNYSEEFSNLGKHMQILAHAASGYRKVLEENRRLYNQVQDLKGNIRVYCRVRPFLPGKVSNLNTTIGHVDDGSIIINTPSKYGKDGHKSFNFNRVFGPAATQAEVYYDTQPLIRSILDGYNVCIFAYGQTGAGKTYTMSGPNELTEESYGVNYRALNDLFQISRERKDTFCYEISVQMIEIYNEQVRDLLNSDAQQKRLDIRSNSKGLAVPDANLVPVTSTEDVIGLMDFGQKNRAVSFTAMNDRSSRSHSCLTIHVQGRELTSGVILRGCLHLVDLAGSERVNKSDVKGDRLKEAQHINKSLAALGDVISALAQKNSHVPYRNSKLTQLLQDSLGGQAKTLMFIHISPEIDALSETLSTLKFAERVATIELGAAQANKETGEIKELRQQVANLKAALARRVGDQFPNAMSSPDTYSVRSGATSPTDLNQVMEEVGRIEETAFTDLQDIVSATDSSTWIETFGNKETCSGEWVGKAMLKKNEAVVIHDDDALRDWDGESLNGPDSPFQGSVPDARGFMDNHRRTNSITTDESDLDLDFATSDSSEQDMHLRSSHPKSSNSVNGGSKIKRAQPGTKNADIKTPYRGSHTPSPSRKIASTVSPGQMVNRSTKPTTSTGENGKRKQNGKAASAK